MIANKKWAKAILGITAVACLFTGCKNAAVSDGDSVTIKVLLPIAEQADKDVVMAEANKIIEEKIGAKVDMVFIDEGAYAEKMNMKMATQDDFDVCFTSNWLNPYDKAVKNGSLYPLRELIEKNAPELWEAVPEEWFDSATRDGEIYAVPNQQIAASTTALSIAKEWVDKGVI